MTEAQPDAPESYTTEKPPRRDRRQWGRTRGVPGWVFLILSLVGSFVIISRTWSYDARDVTIDAWTCRDTIPAAAAPTTSPAQARCSADQVAGEIGIYQLVAPLGDGVGQDPLTVPGVDADARELNVQVRLDKPATSIVVIDGSTESAGGVAMTSDKAGLRWNAPFRLGEGAEFLLLVGPPPEAD